MRLKRLFIVSTALILLLVALMLGRTLTQDWQALALAKQTVQTMEFAAEGRQNASLIKAREQVRTLQRQILISSVIAVTLVGIVIFVFAAIQQRVLKPLRENTRSMTRILAGHLDAPLPKTPRNDEIGDLQKAVQALQEASKHKRLLESERELLLEQLKVASERDFLTQLLNRRAFQDRSVQMLAQAKRQSWQVAMIMFDIDHFKSVNDKQGHACGDVVLATIAAIAQAQFRESDVLARYGGEEFIIMAFDCNEQAAWILAERMRLHIERTPFQGKNGDPFHITASFGVVACAAKELSNIERLIVESDRALYLAKGHGRNCVVVQTLEPLPFIAPSAEKS
jgi:diguanylate cyclase (GGDEF)-like protein